MLWEAEPPRCPQRRSPRFTCGGEVGGGASFGSLGLLTCPSAGLFGVAGVLFDPGRGLLSGFAVSAAFPGRGDQRRRVQTLLIAAHSDRPRDTGDDE